MISKIEVRQQFLDRRKSLSPTQINDWSSQICDLLFYSFQFNNKSISLYLPIEKFNEVNTYYILEKAQSLDIKVYLPVTNWKNKTISHILYETPAQLSINKFGIPEPSYGNMVSIKSIDVFLVPLVIFDEKGYRIGYGQGFYDRMLTQASQQAKIIGISFFEAITEIMIDSTDIPMHYCITPNKLYRFENQ
jgi:5-formyltetrahydrofolate cyclo-ligase